MNIHGFSKYIHIYICIFLYMYMMYMHIYLYTLHSYGNRSNELVPLKWGPNAKVIADVAADGLMVEFEQREPEERYRFQSTLRGLRMPVTSKDLG